MLCQNCKARTANVHFTQIINGNKLDMYLCEQCAKEKGQFRLDAPDINDFLAGLLGFSGSTTYIAPQDKAVCRSCGMSYEDFQKSGRLGCSSCYEAFPDKMEPLLKRIHGNIEHVGKRPKRLEQSINRTKELKELKDFLAKAIEAEEYEKAAELRDQIRKLEAEK